MDEDIKTINMEPTIGDLFSGANYKPIFEIQSNILEQQDKNIQGIKEDIDRINVNLSSILSLLGVFGGIASIALIGVVILFIIK